jgi:hypothetical protein
MLLSSPCSPESPAILAVEETSSNTVSPGSYGLVTFPSVTVEGTVPALLLLPGTSLFVMAGALTIHLLFERKVADAVKNALPGKLGRPRLSLVGSPDSRAKRNNRVRGRSWEPGRQPRHAGTGREGTKKFPRLLDNGQ